MGTLVRVDFKKKEKETAYCWSLECQVAKDLIQLSFLSEKFAAVISEGLKIL